MSNRLTRSGLVPRVARVSEDYFPAILRRLQHLIDMEVRSLSTAVALQPVTSRGKCRSLHSCHRDAWRQGAQREIFHRLLIFGGFLTSSHSCRSSTAHGGKNTLALWLAQSRQCNRRQDVHWYAMCEELDPQTSGTLTKWPWHAIGWASTRVKMPSSSRGMASRPSAAAQGGKVSHTSSSRDSGEACA